MGSVLDRAQAHYAAFGTLHYEVEEWGEPGKPLIVHYTPMTAADYRSYVPDPSKPTHENFVSVVIAKARDAKGSPLFTLEDKPALLNTVDHSITARIAGAIIGKQTSVSAAVGNSAATRT